MFPYLEEENETSDVIKTPKKLYANGSALESESGAVGHFWLESESLSNFLLESEPESGNFFSGVGAGVGHFWLESESGYFGRRRSRGGSLYSTMYMYANLLILYSIFVRRHPPTPESAI